MATQPFQWVNNRAVTPGQAKQARDMAASLAGSRRGVAQNGWEGLAQIANALSERSWRDEATRIEQEGQASVAELLAGLSPESGFGDISAALANPWLAESPGASAIAQALLGENMRRSDPMYGLNLDAARMSNERAALELDALRNPAPALPSFDFEGGQWWQRNPDGSVPFAVTDIAPDPTTNMREYDAYAADEIAAGRIPLGRLEYEQAIRSASGQTINIGGQQDPLWGDAPKDQVWLRDANGEVITEPDPSGRGVRPVSVPISGSQLDIDAAAAADQAAAQEGAQIMSGLEGAEKTLSSTRNVLDLIANSDTPVTGTLSRPFAAFSGTPAGRVRSYVGTLQSGVALGAMQRLKEASSTGATGFGALSAPELQLLINDIGALDPDNTEPDIFGQTIARIDSRARRVVADIKRNVSPERIAELGLTEFLQAFGDDGSLQPTGQSQANPAIFGGSAAPAPAPAAIDWKDL